MTGRGDTSDRTTDGSASSTTGRSRAVRRALLQACAAFMFICTLSLIFMLLSDITSGDPAASSDVPVWVSLIAAFGVATVTLFVVSRRDAAACDDRSTTAGDDAGRGSAPHHDDTAAADIAAVDAAAADVAADSGPASGAASTSDRDILVPLQATVSLIERSTDLLTTCKDIVHHEESLMASDTGDGTTPSSNIRSTTPRAKRRDAEEAAACCDRNLARMLVTTGLAGWDDAPVITARRLTRTGCIWLGGETASLPCKKLDMIRSVEAALNVDGYVRKQIASSKTISVTDETVAELSRRAFEDILDLPTPAYDPERTLHGTPHGELPTEWTVRDKVVSFAESMPLPFRLVFGMRADVAAGTVMVTFETPTPSFFRTVCCDEDDRSSTTDRPTDRTTPDTTGATSATTMARAYAWHVCLLLARAVLRSDARVHRAIIVCVAADAIQPTSEQRTLFSLSCDRHLLDALVPRAPMGFPEGVNGSGCREDIRFHLDFDGWFQPFTGDSPLAGPLVSDTARWKPVELDFRPTSPEMRELTGAVVMADFGIDEHATRMAAWQSLSPRLDGSVSDAVAALVAMRDTTSDITVAEGCNRVSKALLSGVDRPQDDELERIFVMGSALDEAVHAARAIIDGAQSDFSGALKIVSDALLPIDEVGFYLDDATTVYRYFGSTGERLRFNLDIDDHLRTVKLVPDSYYLAHSTAALCLQELGRPDEAAAHVDTLMRVAPASVSTKLMYIRILEASSRIFEARDALIDAIRMATNIHEAAWCFYRLAFMEWKLGRSDLAIACYERSLTWHTDISERAREELDGLLTRDPKSSEPSLKEAYTLLQASGIPLGCDEEVLHRTIIAGILCMEAGSFYAAAPLLELAYGLAGNDDILYDILMSLGRA